MLYYYGYNYCYYHHYCCTNTTTITVNELFAPSCAHVRDPSNA